MSKTKSTLVIPQDDMVKNFGIDLLGRIDSLSFPLDKWFDGFDYPLIYRETDPYTSRSIKDQLNKIGGALGHSHLLILERETGLSRMGNFL